MHSEQQYIRASDFSDVRELHAELSSGLLRPWRISADGALWLKRWPMIFGADIDDAEDDEELDDQEIDADESEDSDEG